MICLHCEKDFGQVDKEAYCQNCREAFTKTRQKIRKAQRPSPHISLDGKFVETKECPQTYCDDSQTERCGLCGSTELSSGYGLGSGYGMGCYTWCDGCHAFLNFSEETE